MINGDTTKLSKALEGVNKNIRTTQTQLKDVEKAVFGVAETMKLTMQSDLIYRLDGVSAAVVGSTGGASVVKQLLQ